MRLKIYLSMPFIILFAVAAVVNWPDIGMAAMGTILSIISYIALVGIIDKEIKRVRAEASKSNATAVADDEPKSMEKTAGRGLISPDDFPNEEPA